MRDPERERIEAMLKRYPWRIATEASNVALAASSAFFKHEQKLADEAAEKTGVVRGAVIETVGEVRGFAITKEIRTGSSRRTKRRS